MTSPALFWLPLVLCAGLLAALILVLRRLYSLLKEAAEPKAAARISSEGWTKLDELLSMLLALQEQGVSNAGAVSREDFGRAVLDCACRLMNCGRGSVMLWDEKEGRLEIAAARGGPGGKAPRLFLKPGQGVAGKAFASGTPIFIADPAKDPRYLAPAAGDVEPFVSIPLLVKGTPIGVLNLHAREGAEAFSDYNVKFLGILAGESAVMLHNMDLFDSLQSFYLEMAQTLARAADAKDAYTREHSDRARAKARRVALELGLPDQMVRHVEYAALLHDIGKLGVDDALLAKPGALTPEERKRLEKHPVIGHRILSPVKYLGPVAQMVLYHHEWYDGRGYPEGLKGGEIPLGSRIVAVIDAWDAMTSDRAYRKALGREVAVGELKKGSGAQFDPKVVETFLRLESADWTLQGRG